MLKDAAAIRRVVLACGTVDLRKGIDGLAMIIGDKYNQNPFEKWYTFSVLWKAFRPMQRASVDGDRIFTSIQTF